MQYIDDISNFIFINNKPKKADIIFIPGGSYGEIGENAARLWKKGYAPLIMPCGKYSITLGYFPGPSSKKEIYNKNYNTEWEFFKDVLIKSGVNEEVIIKEDKSTYTYENAIFSRKITDALSLNIKKAIICCQAFHARRCLMYFETLYPNTKFIVCPSETQGINKRNWFTTDKGISIVLSELEKCGSQFKDIIKKSQKSRYNDL